MVLQRDPGCQVRIQIIYMHPSLLMTRIWLFIKSASHVYLWSYSRPSFILPPNVKCNRPKPKLIIYIGTYAKIVQMCHNAPFTKKGVCIPQTRLVLITFLSKSSCRYNFRAIILVSCERNGLAIQPTAISEWNALWVYPFSSWLRLPPHEPIVHNIEGITF